MIEPTRRRSPGKTTEAKGKRAPRGGERVRHILGQSLECFAAEGFDRVTYDDLTARPKVSRGSFYWYFPSKEALYDAVLDYCVTGYVDRVEAAFAKTNPNDHIVKRLFDAYLADFNANKPDPQPAPDWPPTPPDAPSGRWGRGTRPRSVRGRPSPGTGWAPGAAG
jgi:AcrR family transcriptional regulator